MSRYHRKDLISEKITPENASFNKSKRTVKYLADKYNYELEENWKTVNDVFDDIYYILGQEEYVVKLSGNPNIDIDILSYLDNGSLSSVCSSNKYVNSLCKNDELWRKKLLLESGSDSLYGSVSFRDRYNELFPRIFMFQENNMDIDIIGNFNTFTIHKVLEKYSNESDIPEDKKSNKYLFFRHKYDYTILIVKQGGVTGMYTHYNAYSVDPSEDIEKVREKLSEISVSCDFDENEYNILLIDRKGNIIMNFDEGIGIYQTDVKTCKGCSRRNMEDVYYSGDCCYICNPNNIKNYLEKIGYRTDVHSFSIVDGKKYLSATSRKYDSEYVNMLEKYLN